MLHTDNQPIKVVTVRDMASKSIRLMWQYRSRPEVRDAIRRNVRAIRHAGNVALHTRYGEYRNAGKAATGMTVAE